MKEKAVFKKPRFRFINYSGTYQLRIETAADLAAIPLLEEPFWMATSAPVHRLHCDQKLLEFLDNDRDGRVLSHDVRRALEWITRRLANMNDVSAASDSLKLEHVRSDTNEGQQLLLTARRLLQNLGKPGADNITLAEVRNHQAGCAEGFFGGQGIIPIESVNDDVLREFIGHVAMVAGTVSTTDGKPGIDRTKLDAFLKSANELLAWKKSADEDGGKLFPLGDATSAGYELLKRFRVHIDRYFRMSRLAAQNRMMSRQTPELTCPDKIQPDIKDIDAFLEADPLARPVPELVLNLRGHINPAFRDQLRTLEAEVFRPILGKEWSDGCLGENEWRRVNSAFAAYENWLSSKSDNEAEKIEPQKLRAYLDGDFADRIRKLITVDMEIGRELSAAQDLEYLIVLQAGFLEFCNNFVSFRNMYDPEKLAVFEAGKLVIGGRIFNLNITITDPESHSRAASNSGIYLIYLELTGPNAAEKSFVVTPVTAGTIRRLAVERRGVFFDRSGREWDARIVKIVENPVSIRQAVAKPFIRLGQVISGSFERIISGSEKQLESGISDKMGRVETGLKEASASSPRQAEPAAPSSPARTGGAREWVLTGSLAVAALGSSFAFMAKTLSGFRWENVLYALLAGLAILLVPLILVADYRLSRRNLGGLLEASGWAINAEMRLSRRLAKILTPKPRHPAGFAKTRRDMTRLFLTRSSRFPLKNPGETDIREP